VRKSRGNKLYILLALLSALISAHTALAQTEISMIWWVPESDVEGMKKELELIRLFEEHHPDIKVKIEFADWSVLPDQTITRAAAGLLPDVLWIREDSLFDLATRGILMDLGPFIAKDPDFDPNNFLPGVLESAQIDGVQYALHRDVWTPVIFYNRSWFQEAGLPDPEPGWTYDDLLNIARRLSNPEQLKFGMGSIDANRAGIILAFGGNLMNEDRTAFTLNSQEVIQAATYMHSYRWVYHAEPRPGELPDWWEPQWVRGDVAMQFWGPWAWPNYKQVVEFDWDVAPPLAGPAGTASFLDGLLIGISATTKRPDEAWKLVRFLCYDSRAQTQQVRSGLASPTVRYPETLQAFYESENAPRSIQNYIMALQSGRAGYPRMPSEIKGIIDEAFTAILENQQTPEAALNDAQQRANAIWQEIRAGRR